MMMNNLSNKMMNRFFRKVDNVVWDLFTGRIGVQTSDGIITLEGSGEDATVELSIMDQFGMAVPAFAQSTPIDSVAVGDLIYNNGSIKGWIIGVNVKPAKEEDDKETFRSFSIITPSGTTTNWKPPTIKMLGFDSGVMVLRSLINMLPGNESGLNNMQGMLMPMLMMGDNDVDLDSLMPMMLFSQLGTDGTGAGAGGNNMLQMMMMMGMMKGNKSPFSGTNNGKGFFE